MSSTSMSSRRRHIARSCKKYGLLIQPAAMTVFTSNNESMTTMDDRTIMTILEHIKSKLSRSSGPKLITLPLLQSTIKELFVDNDTSYPPKGNDDSGLSDLDDDEADHLGERTTHFKHRLFHLIENLLGRLFLHSRHPN